MSLLDKVRGQAMSVSLGKLSEQGVSDIQVISESVLLKLVETGNAVAEVERLKRENAELRKELADTREELQSAGELIQRLQELSEG